MTRVQTSRWLTIGLMLMLSVAGFGLPEVFGQRKTPKPEDIPKKTSTTQSKSESQSAARTNKSSTSSSKPTLSPTLTNSLDMEFVLIPAGEFQMGSTNGSDDEKPVHWVTISQPFYLGKYEVTQAQWKAVMGNNPSHFKGDNLPVEKVSWDDCQAFIRKLNARRDGYIYRLPSEAEWEYACRAGTTGDYAGNLDAMAWYADNSGNQTHPVGRKSPNRWGLYDMHGNVWEWCQDWYDSEYYAKSLVSDPKGPSGGSIRGARGGGWNNTAVNWRSADRNAGTPDLRYYGLGFRMVRIADR